MKTALIYIMEGLISAARRLVRVHVDPSDIRGRLVFADPRVRVFARINAVGMPLGVAGGVIRDHLDDVPNNHSALSRECWYSAEYYLGNDQSKRCFCSWGVSGAGQN